ncbi:VanW family protein [soil metagenome]
MSRHSVSLSIRWLLISLGVLVGAFVAVVGAAYVVDTGEEKRTLRGLVIEDAAVGNLTETELDAVLSQVGDTTGERLVQINLPDGSRHLTAAELGVSFDVARARDQALHFGREGGEADRFLAWLGSFTTSRPIPVHLELDRAMAAERVTRMEPLIVSEPVEPRLLLSSEQALAVQPGEDGVRVDQEAVVDRLEHQVQAGGPFNIDAPVVRFPPAAAAEDLAILARQLNAITAGGIALVFDGEEGRMSEQALRTRIDIATTEQGSLPVFDLDSLQRQIEHTFADVVIDGVDPVFDIVDGNPQVLEEGTPPQVCCTSDSAARAADAILNDVAGAVTLEPRLSDDPRLADWATGFDITELVAEFTTTHACCQGRVDNIQRFADIVRGVYLDPGESLSLNEHVGERTSEGGFVSAGTIIQGHLVSTVGGGVSQFATTMFNAAFLAGFDFDTYQSHSIYFSRYPYGREATISWPLPDLEFTNTTDYPALIWTSYDSTSITVSIYSTPSVEVEQTHQEISAVRRCTRVDTFRTRTYGDGREVEDSVFAVYRPAEGLDCNGNPTRQPG